MEPDFKTQYHSLNFSLKGPIVLQQLLTGWGWGQQSQDCPCESGSGPPTAPALSLHLHALRAGSPTVGGAGRVARGPAGEPPGKPTWVSWGRATC